MDLIAFGQAKDAEDLERLVPGVTRAAGVGIEMIRSPQALKKRLSEKKGSAEILLIVRSTPGSLSSAAKSMAGRTVQVITVPAATDVKSMVRLLEAYRATAAPAASPHVAPKLHHPQSGRLDAARIAEFLGMPLKRFAQALGRNYPAVHKTPDAQSLQQRLRPFVRVALAANGLFKDDEAFRVWLNAPHPELDGASPLEVIAARKVEVVAELLEDATVGHPG